MTDRLGTVFDTPLTEQTVIQYRRNIYRTVLLRHLCSKGKSMAKTYW